MSIAARLPEGMRRLTEIFCSCCTDENTWVPILDELERLERHEYRGDDGLAAAIVNHCGLSMHGSSIRGGWLTNEGEEVLAFLREHGIDWQDHGVFVDDQGCYWGQI